MYFSMKTFNTFFFISVRTNQSYCTLHKIEIPRIWFRRFWSEGYKVRTVTQIRSAFGHYDELDRFLKKKSSPYCHWSNSSARWCHHHTCCISWFTCIFFFCLKHNVFGRWSEMCVGVCCWQGEGSVFSCASLLHLCHCYTSLYLFSQTLQWLSSLSLIHFLLFFCFARSYSDKTEMWSVHIPG